MPPQYKELIVHDKRVKLIIHGHFYQPPREDPWINEIEEQPSAAPYKNWNYRITKECYTPNANSRVLDLDGKIRKILNNYRYLSFNFGPTLLEWLEKKEPLTYNRIIEADRLSIDEHNGHGNAIAQVYNHIIMPLADFEDKKTQIIWGLKDFESRFGRPSEGLWLSETAVDYQTIDLLIEYGIKYIILSPDQAQSYRKIGSEEWIEVKNRIPIDTTRPYKVIRTHGELAVFYYDRALSTAISFEHLLHNADNFAGRLLHHPLIKSDDDLLVVATDGEVYGHHEPFGEMCISSLISEYHEKQKVIRFMNFAEYLEECPPRYETAIWLGEDNLGSSWSCAHGVGRWYRNCGCRTGGEAGWTQDWRTPYREALDLIKKEIDRIYTEELSPLINNVWDLRNDYIEFILQNYNRGNREFINRHSKRELTDEEVGRIFTLLEAEKYALFMYTSCAWFFTELSGIETVQNLKYAYRAIRLAGPLSEEVMENFYERLNKAHSNIERFENGRWIMDNWILPHVQDSFHITNNFIAAYLCEESREKVLCCGFSLFENFDYRDLALKPLDNDYFKGSITIIDKRSMEENKMCFILHQKNYLNYKLYITRACDSTAFSALKDKIINDEAIDTDEILTLTRDDLMNEIKYYIVKRNIEERFSNITESNYKLIGDVIEIMLQYKNVGLELPELVKSFVNNTIEAYLHVSAERLKDFPSKETYHELEKIFSLAGHFNLKLQANSLKEKLSLLLMSKLDQTIDMFSPVYSQGVRLIRFCNKVNLVIEKAELENRIYAILKSKAPQLFNQIRIEKSDELKMKQMLQVRKIIALAEIFNINIEAEKKDFFDSFEVLDDEY